jgi:hypothetical protein
MDVKIDGTVIEKGPRLEETGETREYCRLLCKKTALRFDKAAVHEKGTQTKAPTFWAGVLEAVFYGDPVYKIPEDDTVAAAASSYTVEIAIK